MTCTSIRCRNNRRLNPQSYPLKNPEKPSNCVGPPLVANVETNLFDVKTKRVVWLGTTQTFNPSSVGQETPGFAKLIIGQLAARGLIAAPKAS